MKPNPHPVMQRRQKRGNHLTAQMQARDERAFFGTEQNLRSESEMIVDHGGILLIS
jgi:hypothetical protein